MQNIIDKIRKIKELADKGDRGEAQAAKAKLELFLKKHNITLEDILNEQRTCRTFKWRSQEEAQLLIHILIKITGADNSTVFDNKTTTVLLNEIEFFDVNQMYEFHIKNWRNERKDIKNAFKSAYYEKHNLSVEDHTDCECMQVNVQLAKEIFDSLNDEIYFKKITA